jgi:hypothetical protein
MSDLTSASLSRQGMYVQVPCISVLEKLSSNETMFLFTVVETHQA